MIRGAATVAFVCASATLAFADGKIAGRVVDLADQPLRDVSVVISGAKGVETTVATDATGHYVATVAAGPHTVMFAFGDKRVTSQVDVVDHAVAEVDGTLEISGEVIDVFDALRPPKPAKPKSDPLVIPQYSDKAALEDAWTRAWLMLDVDERGVVTRIKFLKRPGYDLDDIAIKYAFGLRFDPARNKAGYPIRSFVVWLIEWPSMNWMQEHDLPTNRMRNFAKWKQLRRGVAFTTYPPCAGGPARFQPDSTIHTTRDCSQPDLSHADAGEPWILRDTPEGDVPALHIDPRLELREDIASARRNRTAAIATTAGSLALVAGTLIAYTRYSAWSDRADAGLHTTTGQLDADQRRARDWGFATFGLALGAVIGGITSTHFWARATPGLSLHSSGEAVIQMTGHF